MRNRLLIKKADVVDTYCADLRQYVDNERTNNARKVCQANL